MYPLLVSSSFPSPSSLQRNNLDKKAKKALQKAAGKRIKLSL